MKTMMVPLIAIVSIPLNSCRYDCPCFDKSLLVWIPQEQGDKLEFTNKDYSDTLTFTVTKKYYSDNYKIERQNKQSCYPDAQLIMENNTDSLYYTLSIITNYNNTLTSLFGEINARQNKGYFGIDDCDLKNMTKKIIVIGKNYNALIFEKDTTTNDNKIYKIILAENYGLLKFYEKSGVEWTLIEN